MKYKYHFTNDERKFVFAHMVLNALAYLYDSRLDSVHDYNKIIREVGLNFKMKTDAKRADLEGLKAIQKLIALLVKRIAEGNPYPFFSVILTQNLGMTSKIVVTKENPKPTPVQNIDKLSKFFMHHIELLYHACGVNCFTFLKICPRCDSAFVTWNNRKQKFCRNACMVAESRKRRGVTKTTRKKKARKAAPARA